MKPFTPYYRQAMSEEQLSALFAKLKDDAGLQEKFKGAADLDAAVAIAKDAGFDVNKADWLKYQAKQTLELSDEAGGCDDEELEGVSDEELEGVAGGIFHLLAGWIIGKHIEDPYPKKNVNRKKP